MGNIPFKQYEDVLRFYESLDTQNEHPQKNSLIQAILKQMELGDSLEEIAFDQEIVAGVRLYAGAIIRRASRELDVKPSEKHINNLWLKTIQPLVSSHYYAQAQNLVRSGNGPIMIDEHCRAFRLFWHTTIFAHQG